MLRRTVSWLGAIALVMIVTAAARPTRAEPAAEPPWATGVSEAARERARAGLAAGNAHFLERDFSAALATYEAAAAHWDHPAIRFNIGRCLIQLGRPVEAFDHLEAALRFGAEPLEDAVYTEALAYQKLLQGQIGDLTVRCTQHDGKVTLDGQPITGCPGEVTRRLPPGSHQIVVRAAGFLTRTDDIVVIAGRPTTLDLRLVPLSEAAVQVRRWATWKPWLVAGGGLATGAVGGLLAWRARADLDTYEREVARLCADDGCAPGELPGPVDALASRARTEDRVAVAAIGIGAAAVITGTILMIANRPRLRYPTEEDSGPRRPTLGLTVHDGGFTLSAAIER